MPEVEHVTGSPVVLVEDPASGLLNRAPRAEQERGVEVALDRPVADEPSPLGQRDAPVEADDVAAGVRLEAEDAGGADTEMRRGDAEPGKAGEQPAHPR